MAVKLPHTQSDETAEWWLDQIESAQELAKEVARDHFRPELKEALDLSIGDIVVGSEEDYVEQIDLNFVESHCTYLESQTFDQYPQVKVDRQVMPDKETGEMQEQLYTRVGHEAREMNEWKSAIKDVYSGGGFCIWYGTHDNASDAIMKFNASRSPGQAAEIIAKDLEEDKVTYQAFPGQKHDDIIEVLQNQAYDPDIVEGPNGEAAQEHLLRAISLHEKQRAKEDREGYITRFERSELWCQRSDVGIGTVWEPRASHRDIRWLARVVVMDVGIGRKHPAFKPGARNRITEMKRKSTDDWPGEPLNESDLGYSETTSTQYVKTNDFYYWELWDYKYQKVHYIWPGTDGPEFLNRDDSYPHYDDGKPIKGFFPCVLYFPDKANKQSPRRPYAKPIGSKGWPLMRAAIKFASHNMDLAKKLSVRHLEVDDGVGEKEMSALQSGKTGALIKRPTGLSETPGARMVVPLDYGSVPPEVFQQVLWAESQFRSTMNWPVHQASGQVQGVTATETEAAMSGGAVAVGAFERGLEGAFSRGQEIKRHLLRAHYTDDEVTGLIGPYWTLPRDKSGQIVADDPTAESIWQRWLNSSIEGDVLKTQFQASQETENAIVRDQASNVFDRLVGIPGPAPGLPAFSVQDLMPFLEKFVAMHGFDMPTPTEYTDEQIEMAFAAAAEAEQGGSDSKSKPTKKSKQKARGAKRTSDAAGQSQSRNNRQKSRN